MNVFDYFSDEQKRRSLLLLSLFHIFIITISNYLVQIAFEIPIPFTQTSIPTTWGTFTFPFIFLATDLTVRVFGASLARKIILAVMLPALIVSYVISVIFFEGQFQGIATLAEFNLFVFRIALASFAGYVVGQLMDIFVFHRLRQGKTWWLAPASSTIFGSLIDTFVFFAVAFYKSSDEYMAEHWFTIGAVDYAFKLFVSLLLFLPLYGLVLNFLIKKLNLKRFN
ncbi:7-cyano-7-deazaguanine/7-aminomethyl-7-deazaguanine transporter [Glaesserella parasuis]|uniref:7-cyano-7-deazaguanine/7-aminomethyl-7- deazaguanine transporter n=1 Tax=Glaesserella parasuis TaxID=738 RepID=UPI0003ABFC56|nr:7-cyano-7-deazaguanine/7-aminomethyl-7-deazaguanine transporter [Glaesserella parasuis]EQA04860.1 inner membrane protein yhhQ [Glaesserella parasuis 12939]EQA13349.1 inner membrane protein yhhQ [Glaesserella parasuis SW140]MCT8552388.1 7-cyano-7-deazaguanine/7-aminomethyl-7-deazaguanine transporter [Glaesserella parasuis]MCT8558745.1 7-cyano-7-deazaguanine/7-aminomethyl-7-deazaguanine transporter [Glaesserella parasuis]MCT8581517.1 7-cyano-7-deazaguanine/7-aminomethyl-7-deazaguanine transpo